MKKLECVFVTQFTIEAFENNIILINIFIKRVI